MKSFLLLIVSAFCFLASSAYANPNPTESDGPRAIGYTCTWKDGSGTRKYQATNGELNAAYFKSKNLCLEDNGYDEMECRFQGCTT